jgi:hypothetical protein
MNLVEFLARHLADWSDSTHGAVQEKHFTYPEEYVRQAVEMGVAYTYALAPERFTVEKRYVVQEEDCIVSLCGECNRFMNIVAVGDGCNFIESTNDSYNLLNLLGNTCSTDEHDENVYTYQKLDGSACTLKFAQPVKKGTVIRYLCGDKPTNDEMFSMFEDYLPIVAEYAIIWLFLTDSESKSSLERATLHYNILRDMVATRLAIELSAFSEDMMFGQRRPRKR